MQKQVNAVFKVVALICLIPTAGFALSPYEQDFEGLNQQDLAALANDGWLVFGNVSDSEGGYLYGYGPFPAPNDGAAFCAIDVNQGGPSQGAQQLSVYSDYNNLDHGVGHIIESNVFQEQLIGPGDVSETWVLSFEAKLGNLEGGSTALAFIKTLDPNAGFALTNFITVDMTATPTTWTGYQLSILIDGSLDGQLLQIGFLNTATYYEGSGVFYDNIFWLVDGPVAVEAKTWGEMKNLYR